MIALPDHVPLSPKRRALCSNDNARRIAARMADDGASCISVVRTGNPLQPLRTIPAVVDGPDVVLEMRLA